MDADTDVMQAVWVSASGRFTLIADTDLGATSTAVQPGVVPHYRGEGAGSVSLNDAELERHLERVIAYLIAE